jgi:hypothetical protein
MHQQQYAYLHLSLLSAKGIIRDTRRITAYSPERQSSN